jgi:hypothetical protein
MSPWIAIPIAIVLNCWIVAVAFHVVFGKKVHHHPGGFTDADGIHWTEWN